MSLAQFAASEGSVVILFDASLPYTEHQGYNRGCPPGYAAEFVGIGQPLATPINATTAVRCRLIEGITAAEIAAETGVTVGEAANVVTGAVGDTVQQVKDASLSVARQLGPVLTLGLLALIGLSVARILRR